MIVMAWVAIGVALGLSAATLGFILDLRDRLDRLLKLPAVQPSKIAGESPTARRERFMQAMRESVL
jgi:hypothetical protein